jgi:probable rRNA maturation factor
VIEVDVVTGPGDWSRVGDVRALATSAVEAVFSVLPDSARAATEISVLLTDDPGARELNRAWRGLDKPTNVLSFPAPDAPSPDGVRHLGDMALAFETIAREAAEEGKSPHDHFTHLVVHGTLHLLGHDHEAGEDEALAMEALEIEALARLGIGNPYRDIAP